jgi:hypothetical protein
MSRMMGTGVIKRLLADTAAGHGADMVAFLHPQAGAVMRSMRARAGETVSLKDFAPVADGVADDRAKLVQADAAGGDLYIPPGSYKVATDLTLSSRVFMARGAQLVIPTGVTVTFNGGLLAGLHRIFTITGTGKVAFDPTKTSVGFPEWWGAVTGGPDCAPGINACLIACNVTELQAGDYVVSQRVEMLLPHRTLRGKGCQYDGTAGSSTRIVIVSATADVIQVGPDASPGSVNSFHRENRVEDVHLTRSTAPTVASACRGLFNQYTLYAEFKNVKSSESIYPFHFAGTVQTHAKYCWAFRSIAGTGGADLCYGFFVDGTLNIGLNGGNASIYLEYCNATIGGISIANSAGFYLDKKFTDAFIETPETSGFAVGINVQGDGSAVNTLTNTDLLIRNPVLDTFSFAGLYVNNANKFGAIEVTGGYYGAANGATAGIYVNASPGAVHVNGGQVLCNVAVGCHGVLGVNSSGLVIDRTKIIECTGAGVELSNVTNCDIRPLVKNFDKTLTGAAVRVAGTCTRNTYAPMAFGKASAMPLGVQLIGANHNWNEINCSGIDAAAVAGGSANKLTINGVQVTATGLSGTNVASGVMA